MHKNTKWFKSDPLKYEIQDFASFAIIVITGKRLLKVDDSDKYCELKVQKYC